MPTSRTYLPLIQRYPLADEAELSFGMAPTPYHIYDGYGVFVGGHANAQAVAALLSHEAVSPLLDTNGRALMGVWALDFTDASLGPHHEVQVSFIVTRKAAPPVRAGRLAAAEALIARPAARLFCHGLWNSTTRVVSYNRERLGLNARLADEPVARVGDRLRIGVPAESGGSSLSGDVKLGRGSLRALFEFMGRLGFGEANRVANEPWVEMKVINPIGLRPGNDAAQSANHNAVNALRYFDPRTESLALGGPDYAAVDFRPDYVQHMDGITFVYLDPAEET